MEYSYYRVDALFKNQSFGKRRLNGKVFRCNYDPYGHSRYIYTFQTRCSEVSDKVLDDDATKIIINTKGTEGNISDELKAVIRYMDSGVITSEYTKALDEEVASVKADEKVRLRYMLLLEAYARERNLGKYELIVSQIRRKINVFSVEDMADIFNVPVEDCEKVMDALNDHPDWDDEKIAEEIDWED